MSNKGNDIDLIDNYLEGNITEEDISLFNNRVAEDKDFKMLLDQISMIRGGVISKSREDILHRIREIEKEIIEDPAITNDNKIVRLPHTQWFRYAAAVFIIVVGGYILFTLFGDYKSSALFDKYYAPYAELKIPASRGGNPDQMAVQMALDSYHNNNYKQVHELIGNIDSANVEASLLKGLSYLDQENFAGAIPYLQIVAKSNTQFNDSGKYYLALALLGIGENNQAIEWLESIDSKDNFPVDKLLEDLK